MRMVTGVLSLSCAGCLIPVPLAVYPKKCASSGDIIIFTDESGKQIEKNGLLLIQRSYGNKTADCLVGINRGRAKIPNQTRIVVLWAWPNMFAYFLLPALVETPSDAIAFVPLISGYDYHLHHEQGITDTRDERYPSLLAPYDLEDGAAVLLRTTREEHDRAIRYYQFIYDHVRRADDKRIRRHAPYFYLPDSHYVRVREFLEAELERLQEHSATGPLGGRGLTVKVGARHSERGTEIDAHQRNRLVQPPGPQATGDD